VSSWPVLSPGLNASGESRASGPADYFIHIIAAGCDVPSTASHYRVLETLFVLDRISKQTRTLVSDASSSLLIPAVSKDGRMFYFTAERAEADVWLITLASEVQRPDVGPWTQHARTHTMGLPGRDA